MSTDASPPSPGAPLEIQLWSDVVCPWCWIGEARLRLALEQAGLADRAQITMRSFQLDPNGHDHPASVHQHLAEKYGKTLEQAREMTAQVAELGAELGLVMRMEQAIFANSGEAHQLIQLARETGRDLALMQRLHRAHFTDGADISDRACLIHCAGDVGIDEHEAEAALQTGAFAEAVIADRQAAERLGVQGVPFFVLDRRYAISGAQPVEAMVMALEKASAAATA